MAGKSTFINMTTDFFYSLIASIFVGGAAGYLGSLMITKKMSLVGDALGHVALPGMGLALLLGLNVSIGAFVFLFLGILAIWLLKIITDLPDETIVGIIFILSLASGFLITPDLELIHALVGDISKIYLADAFTAALLSVFVFWLCFKIYSKIIIISISEDLTASEKIDVKRYNFIYYLAIAIVVALGVKIVGSLLVGALVIIPAATARNISKNIRQYSLGAAFLGVLSCLVGIFLSNLTLFPAGPLIILINVLFFIISLFFKR